MKRTSKRPAKDLSRLTQVQRAQIKEQLERHKEVVEKYSTDINLGSFTLKGFIVHPGVFCPDVMTSSRVMAKFLVENSHLFKGKKVLDMCCGSGIYGVVMILNGAKSVVLTDISTNAVENARENIEQFDLGGKSRVIRSDVFTGLEAQLFDVIVCNHPFFPGDPLEEFPVSISMLDSGDLLNRFFREARNYLSKDGIILMPFLHFAGEVNDPKLVAPRYGYKVERVFSETQGSSEIQKGDFSIYAIK